MKNPKTNKKLNSKIKNFLKLKETVSVSPKTILSKSDFDGIGKPNKEAGFLKPSFRKFGQALSEWRLRRLRKKALEAEAENSRDGSLYKSLFENIRKGLKGKMGSKAGFPGAKLLRRKLAIGFITAMVMVAGVFVYFQTRVGATTYQWLQAAWTGGADTVNFPRHGVNQTGWDKFYSKDTTQVKTSSGDIEINSTSGNWPDNFSGGAPDSNTYVSGGLINLKKNNGVTCTADGQCTAGNCDADFSSGNYCHATASSCVNYALGTPWERATNYVLCSGNSYYKLCTNSAWGAQQNCDTTNDYCDAGGGATSGYDLAETCTSGATGGCNATSCTSCNGYLAASTSSCKTTCASASDCWSGYICSGTTCINPWVSGPCGVQVYYQDISGGKLWKTTSTDCVPPQCSYTGTYPDDLVTDNNVTFGATYPAREACKAIGGFLPTPSQLQCICTNSASYGTLNWDYYWSSTEYDATTAYSVHGGQCYSEPHGKTGGHRVRCVK